ncbi:ribonuclease HII [Acidihalobacter prosperus]|uniref:Ribonuclease HII n=1 Tax=Acidihalobacter prosperus TaxID=160660 RepID=A0A1A6C903_9GAMM|nr:ribonuclease HII [Acidihalobacter prosperus]OBS11029.1 Ribonuclease HII [Acidihalobacter prosperus]
MGNQRAQEPFDGEGRLWTAGVDEAGRGPLAGPVIAAAVVLDPARPIEGLADSKKLSARRRETLAVAIRAHALAWAVGRAEVEEIDRLNILHASMLAMQRAVAALPRLPERVLIDGNRCPVLDCESQAIVGGDDKVPAISAASILAKTVRDAEMLALHARHPEYGFDRHMGYPTAQHREALRLHGPADCHRRSFAPVRRCLE